MQTKNFSSLSYILLISVLLLAGNFTGMAQVNLSEGLVAYFPFNANALDASGNGNNGVPSGSAGYTTDPWGNLSSCVSFGGTANAGKVQVPASPSLQFVSGATFSFWARVNSATGTSGTGSVVAGGSQCLFAMSGDAGGGLWQLSQRVSNNLNHQIGNNGMTAFTGTIAPYTLGEWFHYTLTMDANGHKVYINGVLSSSNAVAANFSTLINRSLSIGRFVSNWYPLNGAVDEFRVYNRVINADEIAAIQVGQLVDVAITSTVSSAYCAGSTVTLNVESTGDLAAGNTYTLQLSNSAGSFTSPLASSTLVSDLNSAALSLVIPDGVPTGTGYRLRVLTSAPFAASAPTDPFGITGLLGDIPTAGTLTYIGTSGGSSYFISNTDLSWIESSTSAVANGGHLAVIPNAAANALVQSVVTESTWIGFSDAAEEGNWAWVNGAPVTYTNWSSGEPNNASNEDYGSILTTGAWNDATNTFVLPYFFQLAPAGLNQAVCNGETIQLTAALLTGASYAWTGPNGFASALQNPSLSNATVLNSGTYTVTYTRNGCAGSASVQVMVNNAPAQLGQSASLPTSLTAGLILYYPLNGNATDASGNNVNGTLMGGTSAVADRFGNATGAIQLNGTNGYIDVPDGVYFNGGPFTVSCWFNKQTNANFSRLFDFGNGQQSNNILAILTNGTNGRAGAQNYTGAAAQAITSTPSAQSLNLWFHFTYSWSNGVGRVWINGVQVASGNQNAPVNIMRTINYIGRSNWASDAYANARLDDFRLYTRELSAIEIQAMVLEQPLVLNAFANPAVACLSTAATIVLVNSQIGVSYQLRNATTLTLVGSAQVGSGGTLTFSTGILTLPTSFELVASSTFAPCQLVMPSIEVFVGSEPPAPSTTGATLCLEGEVDLSASGASGEAIYQWYTAPIGGSPLANQEGNILSTGFISFTTSYYVSILYGNGCESARVPVTATVINPLSPPVDIQSGLILHYTFDATLNDSSGNNYNGTASGTNTYVNDRNGNASSAIYTIASNTPGNNWISSGNPAAVQQLTNQVTVSAWIRQTQTWFGSDGFDGQMPLINKWDGNTGMFMALRMINPNNMTNRIRWRVNGTTFLESNTNVPIGIWHHVVCTYNGSQLRIYQNGVLTGTLNHTGSIGNTSANLFLGRQANGIPPGGITYRGDWDEVKMYNRSLNIEEIQTLFNTESVAFANTPFCDEQGNLALTTFLFPNATYNWTGPNGFVSQDQNPPIIPNANSELHAGEYTLQVTVDGCTSPTQLVNAVIYDFPAAPVTTDASVCGSGNATLTASGAPIGGSYLWYTQEVGGSSIGGQTGATLLLTNVTQTTLRWVSLVVNGCEGLRSSVAALYFNVLQTNLTVNGSAVCSDASSAQVTILNSENNVMYQAFLGATAVSSSATGGGDLVLTIDTDALNAGNNTLTIAATQPGCGSLNLTNSALVEIQSSPVVAIAADGPLSLCTGESVTLTASNAAQYLWSTGEIVQSITVSQSGNFSVSITNANGCSALSQSVAVTLSEIPQPLISANASTIICPGQSVTLTAEGGSSFQWNTGALGSTLTVSLAGNYFATAFNGACSVVSNTLSVSLLPAPQVSASASESQVCAGDSVVLSGGGADTFFWSNGVVDGQAIAITQTTTFTVTGSITGGCSATSSVQVVVIPLPNAVIAANVVAICPGQLATLTANAVANADYQWLLDGIELEDETEQTFATSDLGTYSVIVTTACTAASNSISIVAGQAPSSAGTIGGANNGLCAGQLGVFTINPVANATSYLWSISPAGAASIGNGQGTTSVTVNSTNQNYVLSVVPQNSCGTGPQSTSSVTLLSGFDCAEEVLFAANTTAVCAGSQVIFTNYSDQGIFTGLTPQWNFGAGASPLTFSGNGPVTVTYSSLGLKTVSLNYVDQFGNSFASEVKVNYITVGDGVNTSPITGDVLLLCDTSNAIYSVDNTPGSSYQWTVPSGAQITNGQGTTTISVNFSGNFGVVSVVETGAQGCVGAPVTLSVDCIISVEEIGASAIRIYPNPTRDLFTLEVAQVMGWINIQLTDFTGRIVHQDSLASGGNIDISHLAAGTYVVVIEYVGGRNYRLIVRN